MGEKNSISKYFLPESHISKVNDFPLSKADSQQPSFLCQDTCHPLSSVFSFIITPQHTQTHPKWPPIHFTVCEEAKKNSFLKSINNSTHKAGFSSQLRSSRQVLGGTNISGLQWGRQVMHPQPGFENQKPLFLFILNSFFIF